MVVPIIDVPELLGGLVGMVQEYLQDELDSCVVPR
jgi:hypothetical protein